MNSKDAILFSGGAQGAEACFGENAEKHGIEEVNYSFEGHDTVRLRGIRMLNHEELKNGDVSMTYVAKLMNRVYPRTDTFRKILQSIWYQINNAHEVFVIGTILEDNTVKGGTGWGAEFAKICNKTLFVFDQSKNAWFKWDKEAWVEEKEPKITCNHFAGTGTRNLNGNGKVAIESLFERSFA
jgi:hypothetical protein